MNLSTFDNRCVRMTTVDGEVFEGLCSCCHEKCNEHELGRAEPCLQMLSFLFFPSDIAQIASLEGHSGPHGRLSAPFGRLEELMFEDGIDSIIDSIKDALFSEEQEHALRMLNCLETRLHFCASCDSLSLRAVPALLRELAAWTSGEAVKAAAERRPASPATLPDEAAPPPEHPAQARQPGKPALGDTRFPPWKT
ncbi:MAG: hypothetical protein IKS68_08495 [Mailhella sp.]|nr:hypothetical protein [Mailhella sp.]